MSLIYLEFSQLLGKVGSRVAPVYEEEHVDNGRKDCYLFKTQIPKTPNSNS